MSNEYPKLHNLGHREVAGILDVPVVVEEKIDGSQFSFGATTDGVLWARSKSRDLNMATPDKQFSAGVEMVRKRGVKLLAQYPGWTFRGEFLGRPRQNVLIYQRIPTDHIILFDVQYPDGAYASPSERALAAENLGLETVPILAMGVMDGNKLTLLFQKISVLGSALIEGVVLKTVNGELFDAPRRQAKFVSETFRETAQRPKRQMMPGDDVFTGIGFKYRTTARWRKAIQHLRDAGQITDRPQDIPKIIAEIRRDTIEEQGAEIVDEVMKLARPKIERAIVDGFGPWYIKQLDSEIAATIQEVLQEAA